MKRNYYRSFNKSMKSFSNTIKKITMQAEISHFVIQLTKIY